MDRLLTEARELGANAARNAASWSVDGNTNIGHVRSVLEMLDNGDPQAYDYLPREPNLSGEFADDPTPQSIARELGAYSLGPDAVDAIADAWLEGVSETFTPECERVLRRALP